MKVLRTISTIVIIIGIFVWVLVPFVANGTFYSSDGIPASSILSYGNSQYAVMKSTAFYWMPIVAVAFLGVCLLASLFNKLYVVGGASLTAIVALIYGASQLPQPSLLMPYQLSIGFLLLLYMFAILLGLSIVSLCKPTNVFRALSIMFVAIGIIFWFTAPLLSHNTFRGMEGLSSPVLAYHECIELFLGKRDAMEITPFFWMPIYSILLLGGCLLFALLNKAGGICACSFSGIALLLFGAILSPVYKPDGMRLVLGVYLLIAVFAILAYFSVTMIIDKRNSRALENASAIDD